MIKSLLNYINRWLLVACFIGLLYACSTKPSKKLKEEHLVADSNKAGLILPPGFGVIRVVENLGASRHLAVTEQGIIYTKIMGAVAEGKGIIQIKDTTGDGISDMISGFGNYGGTGMAIKNGYLYASSDEAVYRYRLNDDGEIEQKDNPETVVTGLKKGNQHASKSIALDNEGNIYVTVGAYSNSCQEEDRTPGSKGIMPCPILDSAGGIWQFKANTLNQTYANGIRYATGIRNVVGLDWNEQTKKLYIMMHGRDDLFRLFPNYYTLEMNAELPAETMYSINKGDDIGWPYTYYDPFLKKKIISPEYGGDGKKEGGKNAIDPIMAFPAHLAPNGLLFYTGDQFPARYKNGAFIAFHGSWNRAPLPQIGYYIVFVPFENGHPTGKWEVFADGFAGMKEIVGFNGVLHRPCGLAQGPDGSLFVADDHRGTIYRIFYQRK